MGEREHLIDAQTARTLDGLFRQRVTRTPGGCAYRSYDRNTEAWVDYTWEDMAAAVGRWQAALRAEGLRSGDRVALLLRNCPEWVMFEQAALGLGLVVVPLYVEDRADNTAFILEDAGASLVLLQDAHHWRRLAPLADKLGTVKRILLLSHTERDLPEEPRLRWVSEWLPAEPQPLAAREGDPNELATIVYTSGTTGRPKGVMLSHLNILANAEASLDVIDVHPEDVLLSFLPLSHTFERTCGHYVPMMACACVAYARSVQQLSEDLLTVRPTLLVSVPRVYERIYDRVQAQLAQKSAVARGLFRLTTAVGWRRFLHEQGQARWSPQLLLWPLLERLVALRFQQRLGGRLRFTISGGAALPLPVARTFIGLGINIVQGYGLTETSPVISGNRPDKNYPASVGQPLPGVEVKLGPDNELLTRSPSVMLGYWNNHRATRDIIEPDGWLHTGDQVRIDPEGHIYITGRIKDILVMSNGEKVPPADLEAAITLDPWFEQAMVIGEGKPYLSALVVLNGERWVGLAKEHNLDPFDPHSLGDRRLHQTLVQHIARLLRGFPGYAKVRRIAPLLEPWSVENGLLTPTLKVKRNQVLERYATQVAALYGQASGSL